MCGEAENSEGAGRLLGVWPLLFCRWLCTPLALSTCFLTVFLCHVFLACVRVWRRLAWVCRHTFYVMVYLCVFRYRL